MKQRLANYWDSFSFVGLIFATLFFAASVTPSLLPRIYLVQGLVSGFSLAIGYGIGIASLWLYEFLELRQPTEKTQRVLKWLTVAVVACVFVTFVWRMTFWQNSIRQRMDLPEVETAYPYRTVLIALVFGAALIAAGRIFGKCTRFVSAKLQRFVPRRVAQAIGFAVVVFLVLFLSNDVVAVQLLQAADNFFSKVDQAVDDDFEPPSQPGMTGSEQSLIAWQPIGRQGKSFLVDGPTREEISAVTGEEALAPIRVYAGMRSRPTMRERAELALQELIRVGGFERSILVIATPTGTGWLDPSAVDTLEFLHRGDTAIVSMQYSYLPSWITILVDPRRSIESATALFEAIYDHWKTLPPDQRPELYLHGLSLGSLGSESSTDLFTIFEDPIQGFVWSGPPFPSRGWNQAVAKRNQDSPAWLPEFRDGRMLRFTSQKNHLNTGQPWGKLRGVYIQYASDPMVWFSPNLAWRRPDWLGSERGPDVSPHLRWYPIITFLQVAFDLPVATTVPLGHGHNYSPSSYIDAWIAVTDPKGWTEKQTEKLKEFFRQQATPKP